MWMAGWFPCRGGLLLALSIDHLQVLNVVECPLPLLRAVNIHFKDHPVLLHFLYLHSPTVPMIGRTTPAI